MEKDYFKSREEITIVKLRQVRKDLPYLCNEYFVGIETSTSPLTRLGYALDLRIFFDYLCNKQDGRFMGKDVHDLSFDDLEKIEALDIEMFLEYLSDYEFDGIKYTNTKKTKARKLSTLKSFFKYFYCKDKIYRDPAAKVRSPKIPEKPIVRFEQDEVVKFLDNVESGAELTKRQQAFHAKTEKRDYAICTLFLGTGIRISELVGLNLKDIDFDKNQFKITRKGGNQDVLYFNDEVKDALLEYLDDRAQNEELDNEPALFCSRQNKRMCVRSVEKLIKKYAEVTTPLKHITPHKLRTTYGTNLYKETRDIFVVAEVLGHKDVNTTKKHYAAISEDIKKEAADKVYLRSQDNLDKNLSNDSEIDD